VVDAWVSVKPIELPVTTGVVLLIVAAPVPAVAETVGVVAVFHVAPLAAERLTQILVAAPLFDNAPANGSAIVIFGIG
jgi:hypothetical protein